MPVGDVAYYVYDFDDDGASELLVLELTDDGTVSASMYEFDGDVALEEEQKLIEIDDNENEKKAICRMIGGVPSFANAFVYKVGDETRIGFEFAYKSLHWGHNEQHILSYAYVGNALELRDYHWVVDGYKSADDVKDHRDYYKKLYEKFVGLGAGAMSEDDIISLYNMKTHFIEYMKDVHEIYRVENTLIDGEPFDYVKWEKGGREIATISTINFTDLKGLINGDGPKYKEPVPFPEEEVKTGEGQKDQSTGTGQQDQNTGNSQQDQNSGTGQQDQNSGTGQQEQGTDEGQQDQNAGNAGSDSANGEQQSEQAAEPATDENGGQNTETPSDDSAGAPADNNAGGDANQDGNTAGGNAGKDGIDLSFLDGVWEQIGGRMEGYTQPTIVFEGYTAHYHTEEKDYDVTVSEIVKTDYGYFLKMDDGTHKYGFRWDTTDPDTLSHVDTWDTEDMSTYSGSSSYGKVK